MNNCSYYQAVISKPETWFVTATLRSFEHLCFDRTLDKEQGIFEFFVPQDLEHYFVALMKNYEHQGTVTHLKKLPNRIIDPSTPF